MSRLQFFSSFSKLKAIFINELGNNSEIESDILGNAHPRIQLPALPLVSQDSVQN